MQIAAPQVVWLGRHRSVCFHSHLQCGLCLALLVMLIVVAGGSLVWIHFQLNCICRAHNVSCPRKHLLPVLCLKVLAPSVVADTAAPILGCRKNGTTRARDFNTKAEMRRENTQHVEPLCIKGLNKQTNRRRTAQLENLILAGGWQSRGMAPHLPHSLLLDGSVQGVCEKCR